MIGSTWIRLNWSWKGLSLNFRKGYNMNEIHHVKVEESDIKESRDLLENEEYHKQLHRRIFCPVALAIRRTLNCHVSVYDSDARIRGFSCNLPFPVRNWIKAFDS